MSSSVNSITSLTDVKVKLTDDQTEVEWVQVRDMVYDKDMLLEVYLHVEVLCSELMRARWESICWDGEDKAKEGICLGILRYENHNHRPDPDDGWLITNNYQTEWDLALSSVIDRFFGLM